MFLSDSHIHSTCSDDAHNTMLEMAIASYSRGVSHVCFTDHCDLDNFETGLPDPYSFPNYGKMLKMYNEALSGAPKEMTIRLGLELGEGNHDIKKAREIVSFGELDFVLGAIHNLKGRPDFYHTVFKDEAAAAKLIEGYLDELLEMAEMDFFDVLAHLGYPVRYIRKAGLKTELDFDKYRDMLEKILKTLIENGKGIEINCSGFRNPTFLRPMPDIDILRLYRELGGEIITVGSDAHTAEAAGLGLKEGFEILRDLGYKYVTVFEKRKPQFAKLS